MSSTSVNLIEWLEGHAKVQPTDFPKHDHNYYKQFESVHNYLNLEVHPNVEKLAMMIDGGFLTDHGPEHIRTVIERASALIGDPSNKLSGYEVYILLLAIHFHDVGNIYGREGHEKQLFDIMEKCKSFMGNDSIERRIIQQIAEAHGGKDRDKISALNPDEPLNNQNVRMQRLAAILRFADELADDKNRANRFVLDMGRIPTESEIYHIYAKQLHTVKVNPEDRVVDLVFEFTEEVALKTFGKGKGRVYLLDEIYQRTIKMHRERTYCVRFMRDIAPIEKINVTIDVYDNKYQSKLKKIAYQLKDSGYPDDLDKDIFKACPELHRESGVKLKKYLTSRNKH